MAVQYPKLNGFRGPFPDPSRPGMFEYYNDATGERVNADVLMRALQERNQQHQAMAPAQPGGSHWDLSGVGGTPPAAHSGPSMSSARDQLRGGSPAPTEDPFRTGYQQPAPAAEGRYQPAPTNVAPHQLKGNSMTALYASGRLRPHHQIAYYPTTHAQVLLTDHHGKQAEYIIERRDEVDINEHVVIDIADAYPLDNERRLTSGGALTRRRCPDSYPMLENVIEGNSVMEAMNAARVYNLVCGDTNTIMPSVVRSTICPLPMDLTNAEDRFDDLNFSDLDGSVDIAQVGARIERGLATLARMELQYAYRWFNTTLLDMINHVLRFELRAPVQLEYSVRDEMHELIDWLRGDEGQPFAEDFTKQFIYLLTTTLGLEVAEAYSSVDGKEDRPVSVLTRVSRTPIVTIKNDPEVMDAIESNTAIVPVTDGQILDQVAPSFHKVAEEAVVNIHHANPYQDNFHFYLNVLTGNGFEIFAMRRKKSGWNFWIKRVVES